MSATITDILEARRATHGSYKDHATCTQAIMQVCMAQPNWRVLCPEYKEGIHMIAHKLGRILTGIPYYEDHVIDIIGYTTLMRLFAEQHNMALSQMGVTTSDPINGPE